MLIFPIGIVMILLHGAFTTTTSEHFTNVCFQQLHLVSPIKFEHSDDTIHWVVFWSDAGKTGNCVKTIGKSTIFVNSDKAMNIASVKIMLSPLVFEHL